MKFRNFSTDKHGIIAFINDDGPFEVMTFLEILNYDYDNNYQPADLFLYIMNQPVVSLFKYTFH